MNRWLTVADILRVNAELFADKEGAADLYRSLTFKQWNARCNRLANALAALQVGIRHFDTAFGGFGGCPFIKNATGNISTEDFVVMLHQLGLETGIDVARVAAVSRFLEDFFGKQADGKMHRLMSRDDVQLRLGPRSRQ